ncbi:MAG TPA: methyltransferase domain-containing protein [Syntrophales bacterium]|nr:methyltransferase domain-containing protein [Syntrophales bacterium]
MTKKLDLGCGLRESWYEPDNKEWIRIDPYIDDPEIVKAFADKLPYEDNSIDGIFSSHTLEHIGKFKIVDTLKEWYRILKPEGKLTVRVPDLEWCCNWWLNHQTTGWDLDLIFGNQSREGEEHKTGFNRDIMVDYLKEAGFGVKIFNELETHSQKTLEFICQK